MGDGAVDPVLSERMWYFRRRYRTVKYSLMSFKLIFIRSFSSSIVFIFLVWQTSTKTNGHICLNFYLMHRTMFIVLQRPKLTTYDRCISEQMHHFKSTNGSINKCFFTSSRRPTNAEIYHHEQPHNFLCINTFLAGFKTLNSVMHQICLRVCVTGYSAFSFKNTLLDIE